MYKLIPLILIIFLWTGTASAYITAEERKKFDDGLNRIQQRQDKYEYRKETDRGRIERYRAKKQVQAKRKKELEKIAKRNSRLARERMIRDTNERVRALKKGQCTTDEITGLFICK